MGVFGAAILLSAAALATLRAGGVGYAAPEASDATQALVIGLASAELVSFVAGGTPFGAFIAIVYSAAAALLFPAAARFTPFWMIVVAMVSFAFIQMAVAAAVGYGMVVWRRELRELRELRAAAAATAAVVLAVARMAYASGLYPAEDRAGLILVLIMSVLSSVLSASVAQDVAVTTLTE